MDSWKMTANFRNTMKKHLVLLCFTFFAGMYSASAIQQYQEGDTLFVWAKSGLVLRTAPDFKAEKILTLPYGTAVKTNSYKFRDEDIAETEVAVVQPYNFNSKSYPPELSLEEGFLLANYFYDLEKNSNRPAKTGDEEDSPYLLLKSSENLLDFKSDDSLSSGRITIGCVNGVVVISTFFSC